MSSRFRTSTRNSDNERDTVMEIIMKSCPWISPPSGTGHVGVGAEKSVMTGGEKEDQLTRPQRNGWENLAI